MPSLGQPGEKPKRCAKHQIEGDVEISSIKCEMAGCTKRRLYGVVGGKAERCGTHKHADDIRVNAKKCEYPGCDTGPSFGEKGDKALRCAKHRNDGDVNFLIADMCDFPDCPKRACYGIPGGRPTRCSAHAEMNHIDVKTKNCEYKDCDTYPSFGPANGKPVRCKSHRTLDDVNLAGRKCETPGCTKKPSFGPVGERSARCLAHKFASDIDITHAICQYPECISRAKYRPLFGKVTHCTKHRQPGESSVAAKCKVSKCRGKPLFTNIPDSVWPIRCDAHRVPDDISLISKECSICCEIRWVQNVKDGVCMDCSTKIKHSTRGVKEEKVAQLFRANGITPHLHDKIAEGSCHRYRMDFVFFGYTGRHIVIVEVDEHQHKRGEGYACDCEQIRMINTANDWDGMAVVFIRFNVDSYTPADSDEKMATAPVRERRLLQTLERWRRTEPTSLLTVAYLYYDGEDGRDSYYDVDIDDMFVKQETLPPEPLDELIEAAALCMQDEMARIPEREVDIDEDEDQSEDDDDEQPHVTIDALGNLARSELTLHYLMQEIEDRIHNAVSSTFARLNVSSL